jgi:tetrahydrodipicolinate N-succinyltransferase
MVAVTVALLTSVGVPVGEGVRVAVGVAVAVEVAVGLASTGPEAVGFAPESLKGVSVVRATSTPGAKGCTLWMWISTQPLNNRDRIKMER